MGRPRRTLGLTHTHTEIEAADFVPTEEAVALLHMSLRTLKRLVEANQLVYERHYLNPTCGPNGRKTWLWHVRNIHLWRLTPPSQR
jgi:hypothetical protein